MSRFLAVLACASLLLLVPPPPASAQTGPDLAIVVDSTSVGLSAPWGWLTNVPSGATSATVTVTLSDGSTQTLATSADKGWKFDFSKVQSSGPWVEVTAMTSNGAGASLPNTPMINHGVWPPPVIIP